MVYVNPLDAMTAGFVIFMDNDFVHKLMKKLGSQFCRSGVLLFDFKKALNTDRLYFSGFNYGTQIFNEI